MWNYLLEWCAGIFGLTTRSRLGSLIVASLVLLALGVFFGARWGLVGWLPPALLMGLAVFSARQVARARDAVWRAACRTLDDPRQAPDVTEAPGLEAPTATSLRLLAEAVSAARRGDYAAAEAHLPHIERDCLRPEEAQLLDATRAMISMGAGASQRAAKQAVIALPTGSDEIDLVLGRAVATDAWGEPGRLEAIRVAWQRAGVAEDAGAPLARLHRLIALRIDQRLVDEVRPDDARRLAGEARAIGDDDLATELEARGRAGYR